MLFLAYAMYIVQCTMYFVQCAVKVQSYWGLMYSVHCTLYSVQCTVGVWSCVPVVPCWAQLLHGSLKW